MAKPPEPETNTINGEEDEAAAATAAAAATSWGTWDELLLASAVQLHGSDAWDSVASEIQSRTSLPLLLTTPNHCRLKYHDLRQRFSAAVAGEFNDSAAPWLDELRKLRVAELRQEVQRYDVSILSLQLKVKKLEEEKQQSLTEENRPPDLPADSKPDGRSDNGNLVGHGETGPSIPAITAAKSAAGEESDRENRSVNGSNSTGRDKAEREPEPEETVPVGTGSSERADRQVSEESKPEGVDSYNGSSEPNRGRTGDEEEESDDELQESSHSQENSSDVQSSASLTRKKKSKGRQVNEIGSGGEAADTDDGSPAVDLAGAAAAPPKSQPLVEIFKRIQAHKHSSFFERRVAVQESEQYQNIIRQHMDMETIQSKLMQGSYLSRPLAFFRDLFLLFNNAIVFYPKSSPESIAATELQHLISTELCKKSGKKRTATPRSSSTHDPEPATVRPKPDLERSDSLLAKHKSSAPIIVCRKRSSFSAKPSPAALGQKGEPWSEDKGPASDPTQQQQLGKAGQDQQNIMKINNAAEKSVTGARSMRRSGSNIKSSASTATKTSKKSPAGSTTIEKVETPKTDQKKTQGAAVSTKKRSAADFLKRIKRNSPAGKVKSTASDSKGGGGGNGDQKKKHSGKGDDKGEEKTSKQSGGNSSTKHVKEDSSPSKRSVGRPPKKGGDSNVGGKRGKDDGGAGKEEAVTTQLKRPRKRTKR